MSRAAHCVYSLSQRFVACNDLYPARHRTDRDKSAAGEDRSEPVSASRVKQYFADPAIGAAEAAEAIGDR
jgi:hypothetical protein